MEGNLIYDGESGKKNRKKKHQYRPHTKPDQKVETTTDAMNASQVQALLNVMEVMDVDVTNGS